jgi:hypothetical protein
MESGDWPQFWKQPKQLLRIRKKDLLIGETIETDTSSNRNTSVNEILTVAAVIGTGESRNFESSSFTQISAVCMGAMVAPEQKTSRGTPAGYVPKFNPVMLIAPKSCDVMARVEGVL